MQPNAARFVTGQYTRQTSVTELLQNLQWRSLQERRFVSCQTLFYKTVNGQAACDIPHYFPPQTPRTRVSHITQLSLPHQRLDIYKYSFYPRTTRVWNILPQAPPLYKGMLHPLLNLSSGSDFYIPCFNWTELSPLWISLFNLHLYIHLHQSDTAGTLCQTGHFVVPGPSCINVDVDVDQESVGWSYFFF